MRVFSRLAPIVNSVTSDEEVCIDIGSSRTRIITDTKVVCNQPTCIALHANSGSVIAVGDRAYQLLGKVVPGIEVVFPVSHGKIADAQAFTQFLRAVTKKYIRPGFVTSLVGIHGVIAVAASQTPAQRALIQDCIRAAGWHRVTIYDASVAVAAAVAKKMLDSGHVALCDIGGTQTDLSVVSVGAVSYARTISWGGLALTNLLQNHIRTEYQTAVGWHTVEALKKELPLFPNSSRKSPQKRSVRGKNVVTQTAKTIVLTDEGLRPAVIESVNELLFEIKNFIGSLPSELASDILRNGIFASGGGAQLNGLTDYIAKELQTTLHVDEDPSWDVVRGLLEITHREE